VPDLAERGHGRTLTVAFRELGAGEEEPRELEDDLTLLAVPPAACPISTG